MLRLIDCVITLPFRLIIHIERLSTPEIVFLHSVLTAIWAAALIFRA